jgi:hypothetical protein
MDLVWKGGSFEDLVGIEPFFTKIWVPNQDLRDKLLELHKGDHAYANHLLKFGHNDWEIAQNFYNQMEYDNLIQVGEPQDFNVKVEVDTTKNVSSDMFLSNLGFLSDLIDPYEAGIYELGCAEFHVKNKVNLATSHIVVDNPSFDHSLLTVE